MFIKRIHRTRNVIRKFTIRLNMLRVKWKRFLERDITAVNLGRLYGLEKKIIEAENALIYYKKKIELLEAGASLKGLRRSAGGYLSLEAGVVFTQHIRKKQQAVFLKRQKAADEYIKLAQMRQAGQNVGLRRVMKRGRNMDALRRKEQRLELRLSRLAEGKYPVAGFISRIKRGLAALPYRRQKVAYGLAFLTPWIVGFCLFFAVPVFTTVYWSFFRLKPISGGGFDSTYIGLQNYKELFTTAMLAGSTISEIITKSVLDILIDLPVILIFSLFMAVLLNTKFKGHGLVKAIFFVPVVYNISVINNTLTGMFGQHFDQILAAGFNLSDQFSRFLLRIGIGGGLVEFLVSAVDRMFAIVNMSGIQILMFIAALQSIPKHLYEAARVEGATAYESFWKITFPMVSPIIMTALVFTIVNSFATSDIMQFMTVNSQGEMMAATNAGLYSAIAIIYFLANAFIIAVAFFLMRKVVFYHDK